MSYFCSILVNNYFICVILTYVSYIINLHVIFISIRLSFTYYISHYSIKCVTLVLYYYVNHILHHISDICVSQFCHTSKFCVRHNSVKHIAMLWYLRLSVAP